MPLLNFIIFFVWGWGEFLQTKKSAEKKSCSWSCRMHADFVSSKVTCKNSLIGNSLRLLLYGTINASCQFLHFWPCVSLLLYQDGPLIKKKEGNKQTGYTSCSKKKIESKSNTRLLDLCRISIGNGWTCIQWWCRWELFWWIGEN